MKFFKRNRHKTEMELGGQDSFLDLVSNIVGILIILVMVAGIQAQYSSASNTHSPENAVSSETMAVLEKKYNELQTKAAANATLRQGLEEVQSQSESVAWQIQQQSLEYAALFDLMTSARAAIEMTAEEKSQTLKEKIENQRQLLEINAQLEQIEQMLTHFKQIQPKATVLENVPTPLAQTVEDKEIHFRLLGGNIVYVPFSELIEQLRRYVSEEQNRLVKQETHSGKVGTIENFDLEFLLAVYDLPAGGYGAKGIRLQYAELTPRNEPLGESLREALDSPQSEFRQKLSLFMKGIYTVTVWVYPDSFEEYQELKQFLSEQGYSVAARPSAMGQPIAASPYGTKSSAQ